VAERMGFEGNFRVRMSLNFNNRGFLRTVCGQVIRQLCQFNSPILARMKNLWHLET
jgi:hypothetical protein